MAQYSLYIIAVGGTGAKCVEAIIQLAATGLCSEELIRVLFIDPDETNGNFERTRDSLRIYQQGYQLLQEERQNRAWMPTEIKSFQPDLWSLFGNINTNPTLGSFFNYGNLRQTDEPLANLFDVLYSQEEREANLDGGFREPAIGSAIMSQLDFSDFGEETFKNFFDVIMADIGVGYLPKIILCGSSFGGTGASIPLIASLLRNVIMERKEVSDRVKIACILLLPYFQFAQPSETGLTNTVQDSSDQFLLCTEGELRYSEWFDLFDIVYLLGNSNYANYQFSPGKNTQRNPAHFVELYAALAARHFCLNSPQNRGTVALIKRRNNGRVTWSDLPETAVVRDKLTNATRFAYVWLTNIVPELATAREIGVSSFQKGAPWFVEFFRPSQGLIGRILAREGLYIPDFRAERELEAVEIITNWCKDYWRWLVEIHQCDGEEIQLFNYSVFANIDDNLTRGKLSELIIGDSRERRRRTQDTIQRLKEKLNHTDLKQLFPNRELGTAGLATSLYALCRL